MWCGHVDVIMRREEHYVVRRTMWMEVGKMRNAKRKIGCEIWYQTDGTAGDEVYDQAKHRLASSYEWDKDEVNNDNYYQKNGIYLEKVMKLLHTKSDENRFLLHEILASDDYIKSFVERQTMDITTTLPSYATWCIHRATWHAGSSSVYTEAGQSIEQTTPWRRSEDRSLPLQSGTRQCLASGGTGLDDSRPAHLQV